MKNNWLTRTLRQFPALTTSKAYLRLYFSEEDLRKIEKAVSESEKQHACEVAIAIESKLSLSQRREDMPLRKRALEWFGALGVWDTEGNCGVLIYINLASRGVQIIPDRAPAQAIKQETWDEACSACIEGFKKDKPLEAALGALGIVNKALADAFPPDGKEKPNQLSDEVALG